MPLVDTGLIFRLPIDEAESGTGPSSVLDIGPNGYDITTIDYGAGNMSYTEVAGNRGLESTSVNGSQALRRQLAVDDAVEAALEGSKTATIEMVVRVDTAKNFSNLGGIRNTVANNSPLMFFRGSTNSDYRVDINGNAERTGLTTDLSVRSVLTLVIDTSLAIAADRIKVFKNGVLDTSGSDTVNQDVTLALAGADSELQIMGLNFDDFSFDGEMFYWAIYSGALSAADVLTNADILILDDDTPASGDILGIADFDLPILGVTGLATIDIAGIADFALPVPTIVGLGDIPVDGIANFPLPVPTITGVGVLPVDGVADFSLPALNIPAIGDILVSGSANFPLPLMLVDATGVVGELSTVDGIANFNLPSLWVNTQGGVNIPMVNIFSITGQTGAVTGTALTLERRAGVWVVNRDVLAQVILGSGSATIEIEVSLDGGSTFANIVAAITASQVIAFNLPPIIRVRLSAATAATVNVWLDADLVLTRIDN